jgi:hypothetical protein
MSDPSAETKFLRTQYENALKLFEENDDTEGCIKAALHNVSGMTLPPYCVIKNSILVAGVMEDWVDADVHRLTAVRRRRSGCKMIR